MKKLTLYKFKLLPDHDQYDLVFTKGDFISQLEEGGKRFALYALNRFFVEIEYDIARNEIVGKRSFISGELLNSIAIHLMKSNLLLKIFDFNITDVTIDFRKIYERISHDLDNGKQSLDFGNNLGVKNI